ncbi:MAG: M16 family metallopeptidase [Candidatus Njordarchaeia archaeon]
MLGKIELDNGLKIYFKREETKNIGLSIGVGIGSAYEVSSKRGISHLLEHMLFKSNRKYTAREMSKIIEFAGGDWNATTYWNTTILYTEILSKNLKKVLDVIYHVLTNDRYKEEEFNNEKNVVLTEIETTMSDPIARTYMLCPKTVFGESDLGSPIMGTKETVESITLDDLLDFKERYYKANNMITVLVGGFSRENFEEIKRVLGKLEEAKISKKKPSKGRSRSIVDVMDVGDQCYLCYAWETRRECLYEIIMMESILVMGTYNILFHELREKRGIGYNFGFISDFIEDTGYAGIVVEGLKCSRKKETEELLTDILNNLKHNGVDKSLIEGKKNYLRFIREKFRSFYGERSEDTNRRIQIGYEIESIDLTEELIKIPWKGFQKVLGDGKFSWIVPQVE